MLETERLIEQKEQKLEPPTVIGIVKMAAIAVTAKIGSIKNNDDWKSSGTSAGTVEGKKVYRPVKERNH
jgi:hypothetical protein